MKLEKISITLRISLVIGLGPLEENETTYGANVSLNPTLFNIAAVASLVKDHRINSTIAEDTIA